MLKVPELPNSLFDALVVGGGIMGSSIAYELAKKNLKVLLIEQFDFLHRRGSSHGESRIIRMTYPEDYYTEMMINAYKLWDDAHADAGYSVFTQTGGLDFGYPENVDLKAVVSGCIKHGVQHNILTREEVLEKYGVTLPEGQIAIYSEHGGVIHATKACAMFQHLAQKRGAVLKDRTKVIDVQSRGEELGVAVSTSEGITYLAKQVVVAAGAWTAKFLSEVADLKVPVVPLHTTVAYWEASDFLETFGTNGRYPVFINYDEPFVYGMAANEYPGLMKISLHAGPPCDPDRRSIAPLVQSVNHLLKPWLKDRFREGVSTEEPVIAEACMYSMTPDQDYILDSVPLKGLKRGSVFVAAGFSGHGFKMAPLVGKIMGDLMTTGECTDVNMKLFALDRFMRNPEGNVKESGPQVRPYDGF